MNESNMMERMLQKGDKLSSRYEDFDFSKLDDSQLFWIKKLTIFSKYRERIIDRYNGTYISTDIKIMFLDQHSMKIGSQVFYTLEHARMKYLKALEQYPFYATIIGSMFFIRYAIKAPIHHKLYKELIYSGLFGIGFAQGRAYYHYLKYVDIVNDSYDAIKAKFDKIPDFNESIDGQDDKSLNVIKNFGLNTWNDNQTEDDFDMTENQEGVFAGTAEDEKKENMQKIRNLVYGT